MFLHDDQFACDESRTLALTNLGSSGGSMFFSRVTVIVDTLSAQNIQNVNSLK